jgi:hypothetical protein
MSQQRQLLEASLTEVLKPAGFKKKANGWYRETDDTIAVLLLQKSNYEEQYYFNIGAVIKKLKHVPFPKEHQCHIQTRLSSLLENQKTLEPLNLEDEAIPFDQKLQEVKDTINQEAIPVLLSWGSLAGIKKIYDHPLLRRFSIVPQVKAALD